MPLLDRVRSRGGREESVFWGIGALAHSAARERPNPADFPHYPMRLAERRVVLMMTFELNLKQIAALVEKWSMGHISITEVRTVLRLHGGETMSLVEWLLTLDAAPKVVLSGDAREWSLFCKHLTSLAADQLNGPPAEVRGSPHELIVASPIDSAFAITGTNPADTYSWTRVGHSTDSMWMMVELAPTHHADIFVFANLGSRSQFGVWNHDTKQVLCFNSSGILHR